MMLRTITCQSLACPLELVVYLNQHALQAFTLPILSSSCHRAVL